MWGATGHTSEPALKLGATQGTIQSVRRRARQKFSRRKHVPNFKFLRKEYMSIRMIQVEAWCGMRARGVHEPRWRFNQHMRTKATIDTSSAQANLNGPGADRNSSSVC